MESSPTRASRRTPTNDPLFALGAHAVDAMRAFGSAASSEELERMLLAFAVHPSGPGFDRARLLSWDREHERFVPQSASREASPGSLAEDLGRCRFPKPSEATSEKAAVSAEDLDEPAASAWQHRLRIVAAGSPVVAAATLVRPCGATALFIGEWDDARRPRDREEVLERFAAVAEWAFSEHEKRSQDWMRTRQVAAAAELARTTASPCNLAEVLHQAARLACQASGGRGGALWLAHEGDAPRLEITHGSPAHRDRLGRALQPIAEQVVRSGRLRVGDCAADEALLSPDAAAGVRAFAVLPLRAYDRILGAVAVYDPPRLHVGHPLAFGRGELESLATIADLTAIAIDHAARFSELSAAHSRQREMAARLARQERLATLGETAAQIAEDARHPVNSIRTFTRRAREALVDGQPEREYLEIVLRETERLERLLGAHLDRAEIEPPTLALQNLNEIVQSSLQKIGDVLVRRRIRLLKKLSPELPQLLLDTDRMAHMMSRVFENALEAVSIGGRIRIETRRAGTFAVVEVAHDGPRTPGTALDHLFVPFASSRHGAGVGLGLAQRIVREHGGEVRVRADGEWSTVVVFTLPIPDNQDRRRGHHDRRIQRSDRRKRMPQK